MQEDIYPRQIGVVLEDEESSNSLLKGLCIHEVEIKGVNIKVLSYKHMKSGLIIDANNFRKLGGMVISKEGSLQRMSKILSLRKEPMDFAVFLLKFRNKACGFKVSMEQLVQWYSLYSGKRKDNVKRLFKPLIEAGILQDEFTLHKDFMINSKGRTKKDAIGDFESAGILFDCLLLEKKTRGNTEKFLTF